MIPTRYRCIEKLSAAAGRHWRRHCPMAALVMAALLLGGCEYLGGREVVVDFSDAHGIEADQPVLLAGVRIGRTGEPRIVDGRAQIPVHLMRKHAEALPDTSVFTISQTADGKPCLAALDAGPLLPAAERSDGVRYRGFANELELTLLLGAAKAREFLEMFSQESP